jgi:hypothetical protein
MSYDIEVLPRRPGQSWEQALAAAEVAARSVTLPPELRAAWERIVASSSPGSGEWSKLKAADPRPRGARVRDQNGST